MHQQLQLQYGILDCTQVLFNAEGNIKLGRLRTPLRKPSLTDAANIGESMAHGKGLNQLREKEDVRSLGWLMMEIMEPETSLTRPQSMHLLQPRRWENGLGIKPFLESTCDSTISMLIKVRVLAACCLPSPTNSCEHEFLSGDCLPNYFRPHVLMARITARLDWEILPTDACLDLSPDD